MADSLIPSDLQDETWSETDGVIVAGHGVASGKNHDPRFPGGSLAMQAPHFAARGFDISGFWPGTLNVSIRPAEYRAATAAFTFRQVKWHRDEPAEDFSFFRCRLRCLDGEAVSQGVVDAWIYYPHPETKPEHFQAADVLEVLAPRLKKIGAASLVRLATPIAQMSFGLG